MHKHETHQQGVVRKEVRYSGHVQGVGFRYSTRAMAANYHVSGYVRNRNDGQVELIIEGSIEQLDAFLQDISTRMERYIHDTQISSKPPTGSYSSFEITF
ncbi:MAG: acylphosphatase [Planctomycetales bacterium]